MEKDLISNNGTVDEELLRSFFADSMRMHVADDGFSRRVMSRLQEEAPAKQRLMYNVWTVACLLLCIVALLVGNGIGGFVNSLHGVLASLYGCLPRVSLDSVLANVSWESVAAGLSWKPLVHGISASGSTVLMVVVAVVAIGTTIWYDVDES